MAARLLLITVIAAVLAVMAMAAPANVTSTAQPSAIMTAEVTLKTAQVSASNSMQSSASLKSSASAKLSTAAPTPTKTAVYSTQGLPASIFPSNSYDFADTHPLNDGRKTLSLQASATGSD
ncbi:hypothetical protein MAM1_0148c06587 [Mucor ambiguus]|uniref:Uncharacterized protein n=1 Tax=Mucor ambiguus TaxID=91626 RepID=A0A0C9M9H0_9FUNG|nr:hypothetical protein MAM1_0148c06587 [Mucor ambiguus]